VNEVIKDEDKALILLSFLSDEEYETFVLILINDKASLSYKDVLAVLVNHEVRRKDKESTSSSITTEALTARGFGFNRQKGKRDVGMSKFKLEKNHCAFYKKEGY